MQLTLPEGAGARDVAFSAAHGTITIALRERATAPLVSGELHAPVSDSVWHVERGVLSVHLDKARPGFWPSIIRGHAQVDVAALDAARKRDLEPAYKPPPDAASEPRRVTDRAKLAELKAEFPQLDIDLGADQHVTQHQPYTVRRTAARDAHDPPRH